MKKVKIDLLREKYDLGAPSRKQPFFFGRVFLIIAIVLAMGGAAFSYNVSSGDDNLFPSLSLFSTIKTFVKSGDRTLAGEKDDRINFLLMGIGGEGHAGGQLTDTIIFTSYQPSTGKVGMLSIPRDMTVPIPNRGLGKVNSAHAYGEVDEPGSGPHVAMQVIGGVLQQDIDYYIRVDFDGFAEFIDELDGLDIYIDNPFTDYEYPTHGMEYADCGTSQTILDENGESISVPTFGCRFEVLTFEEGWTHMDGQTALKYVRSRHGTNGEGSDFARSRRQQKILLGVKDKILSVDTLLNPNRINRLRKTLEKNIATNLETWEVVHLAEIFKDLDQNNITHHVLDSSNESPLYATMLNGSYVLLPKNDDWGAVQAIAENVYSGESTKIIEAYEKNKPDPIKIEIQNGTQITGLAFATSQLLGTKGFEISTIGNAESRAYKHTVIYDLTNGEKPDELTALTDFLEADVTLSSSGWLVSGDVIPKEISVTSEEIKQLPTDKSIDFLIILGEHSAGLVRR